MTDQQKKPTSPFLRALLLATILGLILFVAAAALVNLDQASATLLGILVCMPAAMIAPLVVVGIVVYRLYQKK